MIDLVSVVYVTRPHCCALEADNTPGQTRNRKEVFVLGPQETGCKSVAMLLQCCCARLPHRRGGANKLSLNFAQSGHRQIQNLSHWTHKGPDDGTYSMW